MNIFCLEQTLEYSKQSGCVIARVAQFCTLIHTIYMNNNYKIYKKIVESFYCFIHVNSYDSCIHIYSDSSDSDPDSSKTISSTSKT